MRLQKYRIISKIIIYFIGALSDPEYVASDVVKSLENNNRTHSLCSRVTRLKEIKIVNKIYLVKKHNF